MNKEMAGFFSALKVALSIEPPIKLRSYQEKIMGWFDKIVKDREPNVFTLRQARQSGKNEICAYHHCKLLSGNIRGDYLAFAPTYAQTAIAKNRLDKYIRHYGYNFDVKDGRKYLGRKSRISFLTASPTGNILGHTANIGMTIDEAQSIRKDVFENKILPMTASTAAPIIMVGTAGYQDDILYEAAKYNEMNGNEWMNIKVPAYQVSKESPEYAKHYEEVLRRFGQDSLIVKTQYDLVDASAGGGLLTEEQVKLLIGGYDKEDIPVKRGIYIAAIDIGGSSDDPNPKNDCTVFIVARVILGKTPFDRPRIEIVNVTRLQGMQYKLQEQALYKLLEHWDPESCIVDARGIGEMMSEYLVDNTPMCIAYKASATSCNKDIHSMLGYLNRGLLKLYVTDDEERRELLHQSAIVGYKLSSGGNINLKKINSGSKIDVVKAMSYLPRAIEETKMFNLVEECVSPL